MVKKTKLKQRQIATPVSLVIPVFNNALTLTSQLKACEFVMENIPQEYEILISDDKSTDESKRLLKAFSKNKKIKTYYQKTNVGIAKNIQLLYKKAHFPLIAIFSLDGDWNSKDIEKLIRKQKVTDAGIVIGKRNINEYSFSRKMVSYIYNLLPLLLFQVKTYDTGSIKIFKKEIIDSIPLTLQSVSFESEMLIKAVKKGYTIEIIPITFKKHNKKKKSGVTVRVVMLSLFDLLKLKMQGI